MMQAADVLRTAYHNGPASQTRALLAHGEQRQGVAILPDGTLWALDGRFFSDHSAYRLVPLSAEAGDTDG